MWWNRFKGLEAAGLIKLGARIEPRKTNQYRTGVRARKWTGRTIIDISGNNQVNLDIPPSFRFRKKKTTITSHPWKHWNFQACIMHMDWTHYNVYHCVALDAQCTWLHKSYKISHLVTISENKRIIHYLPRDAGGCSIHRGSHNLAKFCIFHFQQFRTLTIQNFAHVVIAYAGLFSRGGSKLYISVMIETSSAPNPFKFMFACIWQTCWFWAKLFRQNIRYLLSKLYYKRLTRPEIQRQTNSSHKSAHVSLHASTIHLLVKFV